VLSARSPKNIKTSTFEKASKSSHFRSDNQRQISLDLSHTCRIRKRLISLINFATFSEIIRLARCEYSKLVSVYSFSKESVLVFKERCACIQRNVFVSTFLIYLQRAIWEFIYSFKLLVNRLFLKWKLFSSVEFYLLTKKWIVTAVY
jgi:hypothetical protein